MTKFAIKRAAIVAGIAGALFSSRLALAGTYTAPVTAMGVAHCPGGTPAGWLVISWIKFAGFYWNIGWMDETSGSTLPDKSTNVSNIAQTSFTTGENVTGGCVGGAGMSNCASSSICGDGRTYWLLDNLQLGN
jgi:hypothetical protein